MSPLVTPNIAKLKPYVGGKPIEEVERELGIAGAVKLASNENPLGPSPRVLEALPALLAQIGRYPDGGAVRLREAIAQHHGVRVEEVIHGAGSNELIELLIRTFCTSEHHIVFGEPSFVIYRTGAMAQGVPFTAVPLRDGAHDLAGMQSALRPETRVVFIANPNNPTGTIVKREALVSFVRDVPPSVIIALDEAYLQYVDSPEFIAATQLRGLRERLVVLRTFSKAYGLASLRVGYALGPPELVGYMQRLRAPFNVSHLGQAAAIVALEDKEHLERTVRLNQAERRRVTAELTGLGLSVTPSQANFVWVHTGRDALTLYHGLLARGVIVRPFPEHPSCLRISLGTEAENDRLLEALKGLLV